MNSIALPLFAIDPCVIAGAPVPAASGSDPLTSAFAELLHAAEPMPEDQTRPCRQGGGASSKIRPTLAILRCP